MWLAERYPDLLPNSHREQICRLLRDLHALNYFSLSFLGRPQVAEGFKVAVQKRLDRTDISQRYRDALVGKIEM